MPTLEWLRDTFSSGYDSGNVLSLIPGARRRSEERKIGASYRKVFFRAIRPHIKADSVVLELGPGSGSWSRAILKYIPQGELHTVDIQDVTQWLQPQRYRARLFCHQISDNSFSGLKDDYFDFFWSFGVLCHNNSTHIKEILEKSLRKMRPGAVAVHQYGDWDKLEAYGWERGAVLRAFKKMSDEQIWWPRNHRRTMTTLATEAGWAVICPDLGMLQRDGLILLRRA